MLVALTGNIGSGKSTVLRLFEKEGASTISADKIVHDLLEKDHVKARIVSIFGPSILDKKGQIDKRALADIVFSSKEKKDALERIIHPLVYEEIRRFYKKNSPRIVVSEIPLLFETNRHGEFDRVIVVYCNEKCLFERLKNRGLFEEDVKKRLKFQMPVEEKIKLADYVIENSGDWERVREQVRDIYNDLKRKKGCNGSFK